jgi:hypothetical protein
MRNVLRRPNQFSLFFVGRGFLRPRWRNQRKKDNTGHRCGRGDGITTRKAHDYHVVLSKVPEALLRGMEVTKKFPHVTRLMLDTSPQMSHKTLLILIGF